MRSAIVVSAIALAICAADVAGAHPLAPALLEIRELPGGSADVKWKTPVIAAPGSRLHPLLPEACANVSPPAAAASDSLSAVWHWMVSCRAGIAGTRVGVAGLDAAQTQALVRIVFTDGRVVQKVLTAHTPAFTVPARPQPLEVALDYAALGFEHIATGADHLLFLLALLLLLGATRTLAGAITGFTLGHSVTLSLAALGYASLPPRPVEVCIALSVFVLAVELTRERPSVIRRAPWFAAAGFGLLHGLGFAGALREVGLPAAEVPLALATFNGGIEIGQLAFVAIVLAAAYVLVRLPLRWPTWAASVPVYAIGAMAAFWTLDRAAALLP